MAVGMWDTRRWAMKWSSLICEPPQVGQTTHVLLPENLRPSPSPHVCHLCSLCFCGIMYVSTHFIPIAVSLAVQMSGTACSSSACVLQCDPVRASIKFWDSVTVMPVY